MQLFYKLQVNNILVQKQASYARSLWGIYFRYPLLNSAGMFKNGEGYDVVAGLGAGGYLGGTSTANSRAGNIKHNIKHPCITLPKSHTSLNYMGLPNLGDEILGNKNITKNKIYGCPIGWSIMRSPDYREEVGLKRLVDSLLRFYSNPEIDFIEINESCPNVGATFDGIENRLKYIAENFLSKRERNFPVIVKLSNDIKPSDIPFMLDILFRYKYDGINIGNTSINYSKVIKSIDPTEQRLFKFFIKKFGGGVGGLALKENSLDLCRQAVQYKNQFNPDYEFHVIRTGGIDSHQDILQSIEYGISLNQWYTGFFTKYMQYGNQIYNNLNAL